MSFSEMQRELLLRTARETIEARLEGRTPRYEEVGEELKQIQGAFVTLHKNGELRGCIGMIEGRMPLIEGIKEMSLSSAFHDPRFSPLREEELPSCDLEISVLSPLKTVTGYEEIEVRLHGVVLSLQNRSAVFLPQVATEQGWDRDQTLSHLCRKAGLPADAWLNPEMNFEVFTAEVFGEEE